jgi:voltage-gated potassium channel
MSAVIAAVLDASRRESSSRDSTADSPKPPVIHDVDFAHAIPIIIKVVTVILFYLLASLYYHDVEGWSATDCIYFLTVTITTVGYGDFSPTNDKSRVFTIFVVIFGLIFVFSIISDFAKFILDLAEEQSKKIARQKTIVLNDPWKYWKKRMYSIGMVFALLLIGSFAVWGNEEEWTYTQAFYFCVITTTTIGYGDLKVDKDSTKIFLIFYIPLSVCVVAGALGSLAGIELEREADMKKLASLQRKLDFNMIREMDVDGNGVDKCEFLVAMLVQNGICEKETDIDPWLQRFDELDKDKSGFLDEEDIAIMEREENARLEELRIANLPIGTLSRSNSQMSVDNSSNIEVNPMNSNA